MTGEVIKSFLVGLGFDVDDSSLAKFNKSIESATLRVTALYATVSAAASGIVYGISEISEGFEKMGYEYRLIAPAINKTLQLRQALLQAYSAADVNIYKVIQQSIRLNLSLTKTKFAFQALYQGVAARFFPLLEKQSDIFRQKLYANMPKIQAALERFITFIFKAFEALTTLGVRAWSILERIYDFFKRLHDATDGWSTVILGVIAAWKLLNLGFLATPLGMVLALAAALLALYDDLKTFTEGGESLINWGSRTTQIITGVIATLAALAAAVYAVRGAMAAWAIIQPIVNGLMLLFDAALVANPIGAIVTAVGILIGLLTILYVKWDAIKQSFSDFFGGVGQKLLSFVAGTNVPTNLQNNPVGGTGAPNIPLGAQGAQNSTTNQQVQQQTNINVNGAADAASTGKAIAGEQNRVNFNLARNLGSATR